MQEMEVQSLGQENPLKKERATHSSILAWRIPWTEEPGELLGIAKVGRDWATDTFTSLPLLSSLAAWQLPERSYLTLFSRWMPYTWQSSWHTAGRHLGEAPLCGWVWRIKNNLSGMVSMVEAIHPQAWWKSAETRDLNVSGSLIVLSYSLDLIMRSQIRKKNIQTQKYQWSSFFIQIYKCLLWSMVYICFPGGSDGK